MLVIRTGMKTLRKEVLSIHYDVVGIMVVIFVVRWMWCFKDKNTMIGRIRT
jgi:hypothetical protein